MDCLNITNPTDRDTKWLFFMSLSNFRFLLSNPIQIFKINAMVTFYGSLNIYTFLTHPVYWEPPVSPLPLQIAKELYSLKNTNLENPGPQFVLTTQEWIQLILILIITPECGKHIKALDLRS